VNSPFDAVRHWRVLLRFPGCKNRDNAEQRSSSGMAAFLLFPLAKTMTGQV